MVYQKFKGGQVLIYMQHSHMVCGELHICHDLFLGQNVNDNFYSTLLLNEALNVYHKMAMLGICLYHIKFSLLCVQHQHYTEHDTICPFSFPGSFSVFFLINDSMSLMLFIRMFLEFFSHTDNILLCARMH